MGRWELKLAGCHKFCSFFSEGFPNDYQQFLAHFEWFLALFQISDVKPELSSVELKVCKNGIFGGKNLFPKNFSRLFLSPNQSYVKKSGQKGL